MDHIRDSLSKRLKQRTLATTATAAYVCHVANSQAAGRFIATSFRHGILTLTAPSPAAAQDLQFERVAIRDRINAQLTAGTIERITIVVGLG